MASDSWIANDMIFVTAGKGYGVHPTGNTICLGTEQSINDILAKGRTPAGTPSAIKETFEAILKIKREVEHGKQRTVTSNLRAPGFKQRSNKRIRPGVTTRYDTKHFKPTKVRTKPSLHTTRPE